MGTLERLPQMWNHVIEKVSLRFKDLKHVPKKPSNFFGTCSNGRERAPYFLK